MKKLEAVEPSPRTAEGYTSGPHIYAAAADPDPAPHYTYGAPTLGIGEAGARESFQEIFCSYRIDLDGVPMQLGPLEPLALVYDAAALTLPNPPDRLSPIITHGGLDAVLDMLRGRIAISERAEGRARAHYRLLLIRRDPEGAPFLTNMAFAQGSRPIGDWSRALRDRELQNIEDGDHAAAFAWEKADWQSLLAANDPGSPPLQRLLQPISETKR